MITDAIIEFFLSPIYYLIEEIGLPDLEPIVIPENVFDVLISIVSPLGYFLPMKLICSYMAFTFALDSFHILWSLFLRLKSFSSIHSWL